MSTSDKQNDVSSGQYWTVDHDKSKCALCVVCARNCPTGAFRRMVEGNNLALYFNANLCDGCKGEAECERNCPEEAVRSVKTDVKPIEPGYALLNQSEMAQCKYCLEYFAPIRRLDVLAGKGVKTHDIDRSYCPLCRRTNLVVSYIKQEHMVDPNAEVAADAGAEPQYRSARDIQRRAKLRRDLEVHRKD